MGKRAGKPWEPKTLTMFSLSRWENKEKTLVKQIFQPEPVRMIKERDYQKLLRLAKNRGNGK